MMANTLQGIKLLIVELECQDWTADDNYKETSLVLIKQIPHGKNTNVLLNHSIDKRKSINFTIKIAKWNVTTLFQPGRLANLY